MITITESQGTTATLVATTVATTTSADILTAIAGGKSIGCVQNIGDVTTSRNVQQYSCLSSSEVAKSLGSLQLPSLTMDLLFSAADALGQADLRSMYSTNTRRKLILALNDKPAGTLTNPTYITFEVGVSTDGVAITIDNAVMYKAVLEICSVPVMILAAVTTP